MTRANSKSSVGLVDRFVRHSVVQGDLCRDDLDVPSFNRHFMKMLAVAKTLQETSEGKDALLGLLSDQRPFVRLRASQYVLDWAPDLAVPVLGHILADDLDSQASPGQRVELRISAKESLRRYFDIKTFDHNDLIAPLAAYGIALPWRDHSVWQ